jgi:hypothetical protein
MIVNLLIAAVLSSSHAEPWSVYSGEPYLPPAAPTAAATTSKKAALTLEQELSASVSRIRFDAEAPRRPSSTAIDIFHATNQHLLKPINLPLGSGSETHVALFFSADAKVKVALTQVITTTVYSIPQLEKGVIHSANLERFLLRLRPGADPWRSELLISPAAGGGPVYRIELLTLYENAASLGVAVRSGQGRSYGLDGVLLIYEDPDGKPLVALLEGGGVTGPTVRVSRLLDVPSGAPGWFDAGGIRIGLRRWEKDLELLTGKADEAEWRGPCP